MMADENGQARSASESRTMETSRRIAREARRRIELITDRIPRGRYLKVETPSTLERLVVISDTHIGAPLAVLTYPRAIEAMVEKLSSLGQIDELVLLGDIFDFWQSPVSVALSRGRDMMSALYELGNVGRMVFLPGNHDHHIFRLYYEEQLGRRLREGNIELPDLEMPITDECPALDAIRPSGAPVPLSMTYPIYQVSVQGRDALLTHGHFLGFFERSLWRPKHSVVSSMLLNRTGGSLSLEDMENFMSPYYEMFTLSANVPGVVDGRYRIYRMILKTGKALGVDSDTRTSVQRNATVEESSVLVEAMLDHFCTEKPRYFVYGHTHKQGLLTLPISGTEAINTGAWLADGAPDQDRYNILEITDAARLHQVEVGVIPRPR
jgi:UDP-2,3-diacylglucosamine pyrophosphatase LpxH